MKIFKKIILTLVGLIAVIAVSLYLWMKIRADDSEKLLVYYETPALVKVDIDRILLRIGLNALGNPGVYWKQGEHGVKDEGRKLSDWHLPAHLYLFRLPKDTTTWYSYVKIKEKNRDKLLAVLLEKLKLDSSALIQHDQQWEIDASHTHRLIVKGNDTEVLLSLSLDSVNKSERIDVLWSLRSKLLQPVKNLSYYNEVDAAKADVFFYNSVNKDKVALDFKNGAIAIDMTLAPTLVALSSNPKARPLAEKNLFTFYCNGDIRPFLQSYRSILADYNIPVDTLMKYYGGYLDMQMKDGHVQQQDTVVTYTYDENFEPIPKMELQTQNVPNVAFVFKASPHLLSYLPERMFFKFNTYHQDDFIMITTEEAAVKQEFKLQEKPNALFFSYNSSSADNGLLDYIPFFAEMEGIQLEGRLDDKKRNHYVGNISMENKRIHALYQILNLRNKKF